MRADLSNPRGKKLDNTLSICSERVEVMSFFVGPFLGVLGAFALERSYTWYKDRRNRRRLKESLKNELERCTNLLTGEGNLIPTMMWNSMVTSGDVQLLSFDERTRLASLYFEIDNYNYEAKRVRDSSVIARTGSRHSIRNGMPAAMAYWKRLSEALLEREKTLKRTILGVLEKTW